MVRKPELLSPAGSYEAFLAAIHSGCDAVYLGGAKFGARANAQNFSRQEIVQAIDYAHLLGKKVYYTANTLIKEDELQEFLTEVDFLVSEGIDAVILQDYGAFSLLKQHFPMLPLHASTQMTVHSLRGVQYLQEIGFERIVLSRELSLIEIKNIIQQTNIEIECFVHGALCYCYSGQCYFSSMLGGRSGNRGTCAQPCRLPYQTEAKSKEQYLLSPKDIQTLTILPELVRSGIHSFKIEGRMKSPIYVGQMTSLYRHYIDLYDQDPDHYQVEEHDLQKMLQVFNRGGFSTGYFLNRNGKEMMGIDLPKHQGIVVGEVVNVNQNSGASIQLQKEISQGDCLEIRGKDPISFTATEKGVLPTLLYKGNIRGIQRGDTVLRLTDVRLNKEISLSNGKNNFKRQIDGHFEAKIGEECKLTLQIDEISFSVKGPIVQKAMNEGMSEEQISRQFRKMGNEPFELQNLVFCMDQQIFLPIQALNELRRTASNLLKEQLISQSKCQKIDPEYKSKKNVNPLVNSYLTVLIRDYKQFEIIVEYNVNSVILEMSFFSNNQIQLINERCRKKNIELRIAIPRIVRDDQIRVLQERIQDITAAGVNSFLVRNIDGYQVVPKNLPVLFDYTMNLMNNPALAFFKNQNDSKTTASIELNQRELSKLTDMDEILVYGYLPLMVSSQCVDKTVSGLCQKNNQSSQIIDRKGIRFNLKKDCTQCNQTLYNSVPVLLIDEQKELIKMGFRGFRIELLDESENDIREILRMATEPNEMKEQTKKIQDFTRGHFRRGVQ